MIDTAECYPIRDRIYSPSFPFNRYAMHTASLISRRDNIIVGNKIIFLAVKI
jgi:hypothetical protein